MRYRLAIAAVVLQLLVLGFMAGEREWILRHGRSVLLRMAPIDPNDPMRGDYARLDYEISHVPKHLWEGELAKLSRPAAADFGRAAERRVYARLQATEGEVAELIGLTGEKPLEGLFIRGRTGAYFGQNLEVRYGIEALFMQQGSAKKLEELRASGRPGVPLDVEVAVSAGGTAVLKNYQWESLGITLAFERAPAPPRSEQNVRDSSPRGQLVTAIKAELKNHGPQEVAIVDLPNAGSFRLITNDRWQESRYRWVGDARPAPAATTGEVIVLKPGETHVTRIDLLQPDWFVVNTAAPDQKAIPLRDISDPWSASFRIEYAPPSKAASVQLPHADLILHRRLRSRGFNPTAGTD